MLRNMKICVLSPSYPLTKIDTRVSFVHEYFKEIAKKHDVCVIASSSGEKRNKIEIRDRVKIIRFDYFFPRNLQKLSYTKSSGISESFKSSFLAKLQMPLFMIAFLLKAAKYAKESDIIDAQWALSSFIAVPLGKLYKIPTTCKLRDGNIKNMPKKLLKIFLKNVDIIDGMNPMNREFLKKLQIDDKKIVEIRGLMKFDSLKDSRNKSAFKKEFKLKDEKIITFVGRLAELKDPLSFVSSIPHVLKKEPNVKFMIVGDGHLRKDIDNKIKESGIEQKVILTGNRTDTAFIMQNSDVFVATSYTNHCFSNTILEAMYLKIPCILTDAPMTREVFADKKYALIVKRKNPKSIAEGIIKLIENEDLRNTLSQNGPVFLKRERFLKNKVIKDVDELYNKLMKIKNQRKN